MDAWVQGLLIREREAGVYDECHGLGSSNDIEESVIQTPDGAFLRQKTPGPLEWHVHEGLERAGTTTPSGPGTRGDD